MTVLKMRTAPCRGPNAEGFESRLEEPKHTQREALSQYDEWIETAEEYERALALNAYRVRRLVLNLKAARDHLAELAEVLADGRAA